MNSPIMRAQLVVLVSAPVEDHKIPVWEQELSCGAAAMNLLLAAHALGYVAGWVTGWRAYSERVRRAFCEPGERIAGFIFIGHARPRARGAGASRTSSDVAARGSRRRLTSKLLKFLAIRCITTA